MIWKCLTEMSGDELKADRRALLQVRPCNALAYRAGAKQCAIGSNAGIARRRGLISHRVLVEAEAVRVWWPNGDGGTRKREEKSGGPGVVTMPWGWDVRDVATY